MSAIPDSTEAYWAATDLGHLVARFTTDASMVRAEQAARIAQMERLSVGPLAERLGMSKARAHQMLLAARRPAEQ